MSCSRYSRGDKAGSGRVASREKTKKANKTKRYIFFLIRDVLCNTDDVMFQVHLRVIYGERSGSSRVICE